MLRGVNLAAVENQAVYANPIITDNDFVSSKPK
jgi:hypothetical protein